MDCGSCAIRIENALGRLPGVADVNVNVGAETLSYMLDENRTSQAQIESQIRKIGFTPFAPAAEARVGEAVRPPDNADTIWWKSSKGRLVIGLGVMLAAAWLVGRVAPVTANWAFIAATLLGLIPFARRAIGGALTGTPFSIETLMSVAAIGAIVIGAAEEAAVVVFLFAVGELLETIAAGRARAGIRALVSLVPRVAQREAGQGRVEEVPAADLAIGDVVVVRPGDRVPSDGEIIEGFSELDESPITGESVPVVKSLGDSVYAGSINANGALRVRITRTAADNTIARIIHLVEEAQGSKAPMARMIDRFARYYTPLAMVASALIILIPPILFGADWSTWVYRGLATLLIACPCALVISTPAAIASGLAAGARRGLLIKGGAALEALGKLHMIAFDKTGTLTAGRPQVTDVVAAEPETSDSDLLAMAAAVEGGTSHPLGLAIIAAAAQRSLTLPQTEGGAQATPGKAVTARLAGIGFVSVGSPRHAEEQGGMSDPLRAKAELLESEGKTVVLVSPRGKPALGLIALRDEPRADAASGVQRLKTLGVESVMLTGDNRRTGEAIGGPLGVEVRAGLLPSDKLDIIAKLMERGPVGMVGDGINDAPALARSSVGIAMGGGTDVALETADAALLRDRVEGVAELVSLSRATLANIRQNITIALALKGVFLGTTLFGVTTLWMAILADSGATVLVTANALRLLRHGRGA